MITRPCVGCGYCCKRAPCVLGEDTPCRELVFKDKRYWCGLVLAAKGEDKEYMEIDLCIGEGCCSSLNSDRLRWVAIEGIRDLG